jgi:hypothetical protein
MHIESLPAKTAALLDTIAQQCPDIAAFLLVGGTAISLQAAHRISEDLDFAFAGKKLNRADIKSVLNHLAALGKSVVYNNPPEAVEEAINDGIDLDDYQQDYLVDGVKLSFFAFGDYDIDRDLIRGALLAPARIGHVNVADLHTLFDTKCIVLTERVKSRDLFDLWWLTHQNGDLFSTQDIFETVQKYRPWMQYEHIRHRLLDWKIPATDESFAALISEPVTVDSIRAVFRAEVNALEASMAEAMQALLKEQEGRNDKDNDFDVQ